MADKKDNDKINQFLLRRINIFTDRLTNMACYKKNPQREIYYVQGHFGQTHSSVTHRRRYLTRM